MIAKLRHNALRERSKARFAITKEAQRKASLSLGVGDRVIQLPGAPVLQATKCYEMLLTYGGSFENT